MMDKIPSWDEVEPISTPPAPQPQAAAEGPPPYDQTEPISTPSPKPMPATGVDAVLPSEDPNPTPGFWETVGSSASRSYTENLANQLGGIQAILPKGMGGMTLAEQYEEGKVEPQTKDAIDALRAQPMYKGYSDLRWWGAQLAGGVGGVAGDVAASAAGEAVGIPAPLTFAVGSMMGTVVPAYKKARAEGLDDNAAMSRALVDTGIAGAFAGMMGLAPSVAIYGKIQNPAITNQVADILKRPALEAMTHIVAVQPGLAVGQGVATSLAHGEGLPSTEQMLQDYAMGVGGGALIHVGNHGVYKAINAARAATAEPTPPATPEQVRSAFEAQKGPELGAESVQYETPLEVMPRSEFYSAVKKAVVEKIPENASASQVLSTLENTVGVKNQEIHDLRIPSYLASVDGKINKQDLLAHIESNQVVLKEVEYRKDLPEHLQAALDQWNGDMTLKYGDNGVFISDKADMARYDRLQNLISDYRRRYSDVGYPGANQVAPGPHSNYREFILHAPDPEGAAKFERDAEGLYNSAYKDQIAKGEARPFAKQNKVIRARYLAEAKAGKIYYDEHWPGIENPIVHLQTTDRKGPSGERFLHLEAVQSTGHQAGARYGYRDPSVRPYAEIQKERRELTPAYDAMQEKYKNFGTDDFVRSPMTPEEVKVMQRWRALGDEWGKAVVNEETKRIPDMPFKSNWRDLAIKRALQLAADEGYDGLSLANGDHVGLRIKPDELGGVRHNYDKVLPSIMKKWAKHVGADIEYTNLEGVNPTDAVRNYAQPIQSARAAHYEDMGFFDKFNQKVAVVRAHPAFAEKVRFGLPLYDKELVGRGTKTLSDVLGKGGAPEKLLKAGVKLDKVLRRIISELGITRDIQFNIAPSADPWRGRFRGVDPFSGHYIIDVNINRIATPEDLYASMGHEVGHAVKENLMETAPNATQAMLHERFDVFRKALPPGDIRVGDVRRLRDNAISEMSGARAAHNEYKISDLTPRSAAYLLHYDEWFAEQFSKWLTTNDRPLGIVDKFFKSLANKVRKVLMAFGKERGMSGRPDKVIEDFLNDRFDRKSDWLGPIKEQFDLDTTKNNAAAMDRDGAPQVGATPQTASTGGGRNVVGSLPPSAQGPGKALAAYADRFNRFYKTFLTLPQIARLNPGLQRLQVYKENVVMMNIMKNRIMGDADTRRRQWQMMAKDPKQAFALNKFIEDYTNGMFKLVDDGIIRRPTQPEFEALVKKHGLGQSALNVFKGVSKDFDVFLADYRELLISQANKIQDPTKRLEAVRSATAEVGKLLQRPFFPVTRFGMYTVTVRDSQGNIRHQEHTDSLKQQEKIAAALEKSSDMLPGDKVQKGVISKDASPFLGIPSKLLALLETKLDLSESQKAAVQQLKFDYAPSQSFKHNFGKKEVTPGYSTDFLRSYSHFFFHAANHITRVKFSDELNEQIKGIRDEAEGLRDANKRLMIANFLTDHKKSLLDPKADFAALRGMMFHFDLGVNAASATMNLTQTPMSTWPHLAAKFGDGKAAWAIAKAGTDLNNFYKKANLSDMAKNATPGPEGAKLRSLEEAIKQGVISESQAHVLAAAAEDRNPLKIFGNKGETAWNTFAQASSWMFEMTEQYNRRVAFRAAWELGMREPNGKYAQEVMRENPLQYGDLIKRGWSHQEAVAFVMAKDSVSVSQYDYAPYARPAFMRGPIGGSLFIFKLFTQNALFNMWANPAMAARAALVLAGVGGLQGMPGEEHVNSLLKMLAYKLFGKDFDLNQEIRQHIIDVTHSNIGADVLMHGVSTYGFGIPAIMNGLGNFVGLNSFFPTFDRSQSVSMGNILGFDPFKPGQAVKDPRTVELQELSRAAGAGWGQIFALYNFLEAGDMRNQKEWEKVMPHWLGNMSHAWRYATQGAETNMAGDPILKFDPSDTLQMGEIIGRALGYQPRRLTARWDNLDQKKEAKAFWDISRETLLRQLSDAVKKNDDESKDRTIEAIKKFNSGLPPEALTQAITSKSIKESLSNRLKARVKTELGIPAQKKDIPLFRDIDKYYPEGTPPGMTGAQGVK